MQRAFGQRRKAKWIFLWLVAVTAAAHGREPADRVEAVVNKEVITTRDVDERAGAGIAEYMRTHRGEDLQSRVESALREALHSLIEDQLLLARSKKLMVDSDLMKRAIEDEVKKRMQELVRRSGGELAFRDLIKKQTRLSTDKFRKKIRQDVMRSFILQKNQIVLPGNAAANVSVSPQEIREYYHRNQAEFRQEGQARFRQILLLFRRQGAPEKASGLALELLEKLKHGHAFDDLAKRYSDGPYADKGGSWGFTRKGALVKKLDEALFALKPGEVSPPIETDRGIYIMQCVEIMPARKVPLEEAQSRIRRSILRAKLQARYRKLIERLYAKNYVAINGVQTKTPPYVSRRLEADHRPKK